MIKLKGSTVVTGHLSVFFRNPDNGSQLYGLESEVNFRYYCGWGGIGLFRRDPSSAD